MAEDEQIRIVLEKQFVIDEAGDVPAQYVEERIKAATRAIQERLEASIVPNVNMAATDSKEPALTAAKLEELRDALRALPPDPFETWRRPLGIDLGAPGGDFTALYVKPFPPFRVPFVFYFGASDMFRHNPLAFTLCEGAPVRRWRRVPRKTKKAIAKRWIVHSVTLHEHVTGIRGHRITMGPREQWRVNAWRCRRRR